MRPSDGPGRVARKNSPVLFWQNDGRQNEKTILHDVPQFCADSMAGNEPERKGKGFSPGDLKMENQNSSSAYTSGLRPALLTAQEAAAFLGISVTSFYKGRKEGMYPEPVRLTKRRTMWKVEDLAAWLERGGVNAGREE